MMQNLIIWLGIFIVVIFGIQFLSDSVQLDPPTVAVPAPSYNGAADTADNDKKGLYITQTRRWVNKERVKRMLASAALQSGVVFYDSKTVHHFTASAQGLDRKHHIVNSYLIGYQPFQTKNIWVPWQTLARKKKYQLDTITYGGREEVWQNSRQAYIIPRGDCEDHAIALADWLIEMGYDARVVLGTHKGEGHAWVVLLAKDQTFLLEATQKRGLGGLRKFPLAKLQPKYQPMYMFNRTEFWQNTGSFSTANYRSSAWRKKSRYTLGSSI